jgi:hypothetical protein
MPFVPRRKFEVAVGLDNAQDTFSGGSDATARFHHGTWYRGYVATRGPGAATGEDEADRLR